jgi:hypothetical protein
MRSRVTLFHIFVLLAAGSLTAAPVLGQSAKPGKTPTQVTKKKDAKKTTAKTPAVKAEAKTEATGPITTSMPDAYRIAGLGSSLGDSANTFPYPTAVLQLLDTAKYIVSIRFPGLGMLGTKTDTIFAPNGRVDDTLYAYQSTTPLYLLTFPKTPYEVHIDVWDRAKMKLVNSELLAYDMNVEKYRTASLTYIHEPLTGLGNPTLRRRFTPTLLPFSIETNPGWRSTETIDSSMVYALVFRDPADPAKLEMSITMRPAGVGSIDSALWQSFKSKARIAFGTKGIAVGSESEFQVTDEETRKVIRSGYEFVAKNPDGSFEYVATFLTPRAILLLFAPLPSESENVYYTYLRSIARSFALQ